MFSRLFFNWSIKFCSFSCRHLSGCRNEKIKITVCGAAGNVGRNVSLFLKQSPYDLEISLYDTSYNVGMLSKQLQLINTKNYVESFIGPMKMRFALKAADVVVILTKVKNTIRQGNCFDHNIPTVASIAKCCIEVCPDAILAIGTNPINSIIPSINEIYKSHGISHTEKILGITSLDSMLASVTYAEMYSLDPSDVFVPVAGGNTCDTIVPLFSQASPSPEHNLENTDVERLLARFFECKALDCSTIELTAAFAITRFLQSIVRALLGESDIVECAYVASPEGAPVSYMSTLVDLGEGGVFNIYGPPTNITRSEQKVMNIAFNKLKKEISVGEKYAVATRRAEARLR